MKYNIDYGGICLTMLFLFPFSYFIHEILDAIINLLIYIFVITI